MYTFSRFPLLKHSNRHSSINNTSACIDNINRMVKRQGAASDVCLRTTNIRSLRRFRRSSQLVCTGQEIKALTHFACGAYKLGQDSRGIRTHAEGGKRDILRAFATPCLGSVRKIEFKGCTLRAMD